MAICSTKCQHTVKNNNFQTLLVLPLLSSGLSKLTDIDYDWVLGYAKDAFPSLADNDAAIQFLLKSYWKEGLDPHGDHLEWLRGLTDVSIS